MEKKELKPAFPNPAFGVAHFGQGMTLRDWFAGMAMQGMLASGYEDAIEKVAKKLGASAGEGLAAASYGFANYMLAEREKDFQSTQGKEDRGIS